MLPEGHFKKRPLQSNKSSVSAQLYAKRPDYLNASLCVHLLLSRENLGFSFTTSITEISIGSNQKPIIHKRTFIFACVVSNNLLAYF